MTGFEALVLAVGAVAGAVAAVAGFGIGSLLTPTLVLLYDAKLAVAAVAIPHFLGTGLRFWRLRRHVDRRLLLGFGAASAAGGLAGALLHAAAGSPVLRVIFGLLLLLAGVGELTGLLARLPMGRRGALAAGALSGLFGGMVGNQGGIRSAAMLAFPLERLAFVATATAIALIVDVARLPVYLAVEAQALMRVAPVIGLASAGVIIGTLAGERLLRLVPESVFRRAVALLLLVLGAYMLAGAIWGSSMSARNGAGASAAPISRGSLIVNSLPRPGSLATVIVPPMSST